jgi:hypothetical protein
VEIGREYFRWPEKALRNAAAVGPGSVCPRCRGAKESPVKGAARPLS